MQVISQSPKDHNTLKCHQQIYIYNRNMQGESTHQYLVILCKGLLALTLPPQGQKIPIVIHINEVLFETCICREMYQCARSASPFTISKMLGQLDLLCL